MTREQIARTVCFWSYRDCGRSCGDNYCVTRCTANVVDAGHLRCADDILALIEKQPLGEKP